MVQRHAFSSVRYTCWGREDDGAMLALVIPATQGHGQAIQGHGKATQGHGQAAEAHGQDDDSQLTYFTIQSHLIQLFPVQNMQLSRIGTAGSAGGGSANSSSRSGVVGVSAVDASGRAAASFVEGALQWLDETVLRVLRHRRRDELWSTMLPHGRRPPLGVGSVGGGAQGSSGGGGSSAASASVSSGTGVPFSSSSLDELAALTSPVDAKTLDPQVTACGPFAFLFVCGYKSLDLTGSVERLTWLDIISGCCAKQSLYYVCPVSFYELFS